MLTFQPQASSFARRNLKIKLFQGGRRCHALSDASDVDAPPTRASLARSGARLQQEFRCGRGQVAPAALSSPVAWSLVTSVILWSMFLFCGFGVLSGTNPTTIIALAFGTISVASAMFLILDLTQPYSGLFRVSPSGIRQTLEAIDK